VLPSRTRYFFATLPSFLWQVPVIFCDAIAPCIWPNETKHGVRIVDLQETSRKEFTVAITLAFDLLQQKDAVRFRRVCREIRMIVQTPVMTGAQYSRPLRVCSIDWSQVQPMFEFGNDYGVQFLASVLVHEATHGYLYSRRIVQIRRNYARIEQLCCLEMLRFGRKVGMDEMTCGIIKESGETAAPPKLAERLKFARTAIKRLR
jgi:hypothetical protein